MAAKLEPKLDVYLRGNNNEQISGPEDIYIDGEYKDNIRQICPLKLNDSVTAESIEGMLYLDTNFRSCLRLKRHKKEPLLIESENKKPRERLKLRRKQLKGEIKITRLRTSKRIAQIKEEIKKSEEESDDTEINSNFPIRGKLKPLYKGKLILEKNKELEGLDIETFYIKNSFSVRGGKKETVNTDDYSVLQFISREGTR